MNRLKRLTLSAAGLTLLGTGAVALSPLVLAQEAGNEPPAAYLREPGQKRALAQQQLRQSVEQRTSQIKLQAEQRREQIKQEVCERRQERLSMLLPKLSTGAVSVKRAIDTVYTRVQGFYEQSQLTVNNYDELVAAIDAAKVDAEAALATVASYKFELDCNQPDTGQQLDAYRQAVKEAKEALKTYRAELVALISALRAEAAQAAETEEENSAQ